MPTPTGAICECGHSEHVHDPEPFPGIGYMGRICRSHWCGCMNLKPQEQEQAA